MTPPVILTHTSRPDAGTDAQEVPNLWKLKKPMSYAGPWRDADGVPLSGFAVTDSKHYRTVRILFNGNANIRYRFPLSLRAPVHPMVRWLNVPMLGLGLLDPDGESLTGTHAIVAAVLAGKKPVGDVWFADDKPDECAALKAKVESLGFEAIEYEGRNLTFGVAQPLSELFDLDALARFYSQGTGLSEAVFRYHFDKVSHLTPLGAMQTYDWASPEDVRELAVTGLCLGYAFESTLSLMIRDLSSN